MPNTKACRRCQNTLPATSEFFYKNPRTEGGLHSYCRKCSAEYQIERRQRHKDGFTKKKTPRVDLESLPIPEEAELHVCTGCHRRFPLTASFFYRNRARESGFSLRCKECLLEAQSQKRAGKRQRKFVPRSTSKPDQNGQRYCYHCEQWKPLDSDHFTVSPPGRAGFTRQCLECIQTRRRQARRESWANRLRGYAICRHKRYEDPCDLTTEHIEALWERQEGLCAWFRVPMIQDMDNGDRLHLVTLDRIDSSKGYTKNNTALVCKAANQCRGNAPMESFEIFLQELRIS